MTYAFDPASGATLSQLTDMVLANTFNSTRYTELIETFANDAVTDICRKLNLSRESVVCAHVDGVVTQPTRPFFRIEGVWNTSAGATTGATGQSVATSYSGSRVYPLDGEAVDARPGGEPRYYTARRALSPTSRYPQLRVELLPAPSTGQVVILGLQRPAVMDEAADTTGLGADLDRAVVAYCKARCFELEDDFEMAANWEAKFLDQLTTSSMDPVADGPKVTPGTWSGAHPDRGR